MSIDGKPLLRTFSACQEASKPKRMTGPDSTLQFDFDNLTVSEALPCLRGAFVILVGCSIAAMLGLFGLSMASKGKQTSEDFKGVNGQNPETHDLLQF